MYVLRAAGTHLLAMTFFDANPSLSAAIALVLLSAVLAGCGASDQYARDNRLSVVATVAPITSIVAQIGGDRVRLSGLIPEGTNSHTYEPRPSSAEALSAADVLYTNGLGLEGPTVRLARQVMPEQSAIVPLGNLVLPRSRWIYDFSFPRSGGRPNPHLWTDPPLALAYAREVRDDLGRRDSAGRNYYAANYRRFATAVGRLDRAARTAFATIDPSARMLLTYHDGYAYFARDYGFRVIGAIQASDFEDPTPREVAALIGQVRAEQVPAIFGSEVFPSPVLAQIGRETGVRYVDRLRDDDLPGRPGERRHSWLGLMRFNYAAIVTALNGDAAALDRLSLAAVPRDLASYPQ